MIPDHQGQSSDQNENEDMGIRMMRGMGHDEESKQPLAMVETTIRQSANG
jgi:hypothetical protein